MATLTFVIPQRDAEKTRDLERHLSDVTGLRQVGVTHKSFDPFSADAETQPFDEAQVVVSYDPQETSEADLRDAFRALDIHILNVLRD